MEFDLSGHADQILLVQRWVHLGCKKINVEVLSAGGHRKRILKQETAEVVMGGECLVKLDGVCHGVGDEEGLVGLDDFDNPIRLFRLA